MHVEAAREVRTRVGVLRRRVLLSAIAICIVPAVGLWLGTIQQRADGPHWVREMYDPDYAYLLNALTLAEGRGPFYTGHPGTPVHEIGAAVLLARDAVSTDGNQLRDRVIDDPEGSIGSVSAVLRAIHAGALVLFGVFAVRMTRSIATAIAGQALTLSSVTVHHSLHRMTPEVLLLAMALLLGAASMRAAARPGPLWRRYAVASALILAVGVAAKITFAPLAVVPLGLLLVRGRRKYRLFAVWAIVGVAGFLACVSPILTGWRRATQWFLRLLMSDGHYGHSEGHTIVNPETYLANMRSLWRAEPVTAAVLIAGAIAAIAWAAFRWAKRVEERERRTWALLISVVAAGVLQFFLVAKHPGERYLVPVVGLSGLVVCLVGGLISCARPGWPARIGNAVLAGAAVGAVAWCCWSLPGRLRQFEADTARRIAVWREAEKVVARGDVLVTVYDASSPVYGLFFANEWAGYRYDEVLKRRFPTHFEYNIFGKGFMRGRETRKASEFEALAEQGRLYLHSPPNSRPPGFSYEALTTDSPYEILYRMRPGVQPAPAAPTGAMQDGSKR